MCFTVISFAATERNCRGSLLSCAVTGPGSADVSTLQLLSCETENIAIPGGEAVVDPTRKVDNCLKSKVLLEGSHATWISHLVSQPRLLNMGEAMLPAITLLHREAGKLFPKRGPGHR